MDDGTNWELELEEALLDEAPPDQIKLLLAGRTLPSSLRADVWSHCLEIGSRKCKIDKFDDVYDHPDQHEIRRTAKNLVESVSRESDKFQLQAEAEAILTVYFKSTAKKFSNDISSILKPILELSLTKNEKFSIFQTILEKFIPKSDSESSDAVFDLARLLLLYHDPQLCNHLDSLKIGFHQFSSSWFSSLMSADCDTEVTHQLWDLYIVNTDPWIIFFMVTVMLVNFRDNILEVGSDREELLARLARLPAQIEADDIPDLVTLAQVYSSRTPSSFKTSYHDTIFSSPSQDVNNKIKSLLCLPVSADEILASELVNFQFFVVDCRPAEQYNAGHLSRAFHLDCSLMLQDPAAFSTACSALIAFQQSALTAQAGGEHLVFLGDGDDQSSDVDSNMMMAVARFLQKHTKFISVLLGGYPSFHQETTSQSKTISDQEKTEEISDASPNKLNSIKSSLKQKSVNLKDSLINYIYNPNNQPPPEPKHIDYTKRGSKLYKNAGDVFSLEDEDEDNLLDLADIEKQSETVHLADCQRVNETGILSPCHILVTTTHLNVLLPGPRSGSVTPSTSRHLSSIVKITSKKRQPEIITFKFGTSQGEEVTVFDMDRFYIPTAGKVTAVVKLQIEKLKQQ